MTVGSICISGRRREGRLAIREIHEEICNMREGVGVRVRVLYGTCCRFPNPYSISTLPIPILHYSIFSLLPMYIGLA